MHFFLGIEFFFGLKRFIVYIGADSMGAMGAIAPTAKKLWGRCPKVAPTRILTG